MRWSENEQLFLSELKTGRKWEMWFAKLLLEYGITVQVPQFAFRKDMSEVPDYADRPDVVANGKVLEIKSRRLSFTCPEDYPFDSIFVDTQKSWDQKEGKPFAIVVISQETKGIVVLSNKQSDQWKTETKFDRVRKIRETWYTADKSLCHSFETLLKALEK